MTVHTAAGSKLFIGPVAASTVDTANEFAALSFTEVGEIESLGEFGDQAGIVTFTALGDRRVRKFKGSFDAGTITLSLGRDAADSGQSALIAAQASDFDYAFKVELNDEGSNSPQRNTVFYFRGKVVSYSTNIGNANSVVGASAQIAINSPIIEVAAI